MAIEFKCQGCQKTLRVPDEFGGRKAKCPNCQTILQVPAEDGTAESLQVQPPFESPSDPFAGLDSFESPESSYEKPSGFGQSSVAGTNPYGSPQSQPPPASRRPSGTPHRGGLILGLGIGSIFCNVCMIPGILAVTFGMTDLDLMKKGQMDNGGRGLTLAGSIIGGIMTGITLLVLLLRIIALIAMG